MANRLLKVAALSALILGCAASKAFASAIVLVGTDMSDHYPAFPEASTLTRNAVQFAGGSANPTIALIGDGTSFGGNTQGLLTSLGFTYTLFTSAQLGTLNYSNYNLLYFAPTTNNTDIANFLANAAAIQNYTSSGGGLVVEAEVFAVGSWSWVPGAALIGHSGSANVGGESVVLNLAAPLALRTGLTNAGLSDWGFSVHSTFATPAAGGYSVLTFAGSPTAPAQIIYQETTTAAPEPTTIALVGAGVGLLRARRKRTQRA
jgi:hypothetical protein